MVEVEEGSELIDVEFELLIKPQKFSYLTYNMDKGELQERPSYLEQTQNKTNPFAQVAKNASEKVYQKIPQVYSNNFSENEVSGGLEDLVRREKESREQLMQVRGRSREPQLKIGGFIKLRDINGKAMETYRIIEIKHYQSGYEYLNEFVAIPDVFVAYYFDENAYPKGEQQPAKVVDNNDPEGLGRVRVQFVWQINKNEKSPWLRVVQPHAGGGKGFYFVPEIGEEVLVDFENQNPERPFVVGSHYNGNQKSGFATNDNKIKAIQTRSGVKIIIDDSKGSLFLEDKNGSKVFLDGEGNISFSSENKVSINSKEISLNAEKIDLETTQEIKAQSHQKMILSSYQTMDIEGTEALKVNATDLSIKATENFKTTAQKLSLGAEKMMKVSSENMELHGTQAMELKSPAMNKITKAEKVSVSKDDKKGVQAIAVVKPHKNYKGEYGIDYCEMDQNFTQISKNQGINISEIEYIFDENTKQFKKTSSNIERLEIIKKLYYTQTYFGKPYYATWIHLPAGQTAKLVLSTYFVDESKKVEKDKEFITFKETPNFEIKYGKQINSQIKINLQKHNKEYDFEIKALKTFDTTQYIDILDEEDSPIGIIEFTPNKIEELEIKIIPMVHSAFLTKESEAELLVKAKNIYDSIKKDEIMKKLNNHSLNQAGIRCKLATDYNKLEFLSIRTYDDYKNYWDISSNKLKDWKLNDNEKEAFYQETPKDEDGETNKGANKDLLLDKLERDYFKKYGNSFKGAIIFVTDLEYIDEDGNSNTGGYSQVIPVKNQGTIIFKTNINDPYTYAHELGHMLGLQHTFIKDEKEFNDSNKRIEEHIEHTDRIVNRINHYKETIKDYEDRIIEKRKEIDELKIEIDKNKSKAKLTKEEEYGVKEKEELIIIKEKDIIETNEQIDYYKNQNEILKNNINFESFKFDLLVGEKIRFKQKKTLNYMDYNKESVFFSKQQVLILKKDIKFYSDEK